MSPQTDLTGHAARLGLARGWTEFKHSIASSQDLTYIVVINAILVLVLALQRGSTVDGASHTLAMATLPSLFGMTVAAGGLMNTAGALAVDREDGTLLRAKAVPHGMMGYLVARIARTCLDTVFGILVLLVAGLVLLDDLAVESPARALLLIGMIALGLLATLPLGAIVGSLAGSSQSSFGLTFLAVSGLVAISGIFYPISGMPGWLQGVAQAFPVYWLGLGMRSALLPEAAATVEIGGSWRHLETVGVLGLWAVAGLLVAPWVLRRMARRESGSAMEARRQRAMQAGVG